MKEPATKITDEQLQRMVDALRELRDKGVTNKGNFPRHHLASALEELQEYRKNENRG